MYAIHVDTGIFHLPLATGRRCKVSSTAFHFAFLSRKQPLLLSKLTEEAPLSMPLISSTPNASPPCLICSSSDFSTGLHRRHHSGQVSWVEFVKLFEIADDQTGGGGIAALPPDLKEVKTCAYAGSVIGEGCGTAIGKWCTLVEALDACRTYHTLVLTMC